MTQPRFDDETPEYTTASPRMQAVLSQAQRYAPSRACVLLRGETGVGKDFLARAIHRWSGRRGPFVDCKVTDLPESLLESELFGYERGAFTGAQERRTGRIEAAKDGMLFLNEVGKIPRHIQVKLFSLLDHGEITRLGHPQPISVNVRIVAATSEDLEAAVRQGHLLAELYYRLTVLTIRIPPLRERKEDIPGLVRYFLHKHAELGVKTISEVALQYLQRYSFPGNVRELEHTIVRALVHARGQVIEPADIEFYSVYADDEPARILAALREHRYVTRAAAALGLTRDALNYRLKKYHLRSPSRSV